MGSAKTETVRSCSVHDPSGLRGWLNVYPRSRAPCPLLLGEGGPVEGPGVEGTPESFFPASLNGLPQFVSHASTSPVGSEDGGILKGDGFPAMPLKPHSCGASWRDKKLPAGGTQPKVSQKVGFNRKKYSGSYFYVSPPHPAPRRGHPLQAGEGMGLHPFRVYVHPNALTGLLSGSGLLPMILCIGSDNLPPEIYRK